MPIVLSKIKEKYGELSAPIKASLWFTVCSFVQKGISFITVPIFTRLMSTEQYGIYALYQSWDSVLVIFATLNLNYQVFNNGLVRYETDRDGYTTSMLGLSNVCTAVLFLLYLSLRNWINAVSGLNTPLFLLMFLQYFFYQALSLWGVKERFFYRYRKLTLITLGSAFLSSVLGVAAVIFCNDKVIARIASLVLINVVVGLCIYISILRNSRKFVCFEYWRFALRLDLPLIPHYLSMSVLESSDRILISNICGAGFTAFYSVSYNIAGILNMLISSINGSYIPWFYQSMSARDYGAIKTVSAALLVFVGGCSLLPALFGPEVIQLLGSKKYMEGVWVMPAVSAGVYFVFLYTLFSNYELYYERSGLIMLASITAAFLNIGLNLLLIPVFGFVAAGYTTLACYIALSIFHYLAMEHISKETRDREIPFDMCLVVGISLAVLILSIGVSFTYFYAPVRYACILALMVVGILKRSVVFDLISKMKANQ